MNETNSPKLISILKTLIFWILFMALLFLAGNLSGKFSPVKWGQFSYGFLGTIAAFAATWILLKTEKKTFAEYGLVWKRDTFLKFVKGFLIGTGIFMIILLLLFLFSGIRFQRNETAWSPGSAFRYMAIIPLALMEEAAFRAYPFLKLKNAFGLRITQFIVAIAFALYHFIQGWGFEIAFLGPGTWAFVFGLAAAWSKGIALPTGIHVALNFIQQVTGIKSAKDSIWVVSQNHNAVSIVQSDTIGLISQLLIFVSAILLTEYFIRKNQQAQNE